jgi:translation initiation factor IF-2
MENFRGEQIKEATFSSPIRIIGWNKLPVTGSPITILTSKKEAEEFIGHNKNNTASDEPTDSATETAVFPIIIKAADAGGLEAVHYEIKKIKNDKLVIKVIQSGVGDISENDVKNATGRNNTVILGFNVKIDAQAKSQAEKSNTEIQTFDIIYKLSEWLEKRTAERAPKEMIEEATGTAKVLKLFSKAKDRQILGARVEKGQILLGAEVKILRRDFEIGKGRVRELQRQKNKVSDVPEGQEFGAMVEAKMDIAPGDRLEAFTVVEK